jgi:hypothetical protein
MEHEGLALVTGMRWKSKPRAVHGPSVAPHSGFASESLKRRACTSGSSPSANRRAWPVPGCSSTALTILCNPVRARSIISLVSSAAVLMRVRLPETISCHAALSSAAWESVATSKVTLDALLWGHLTRFKPCGYCDRKAMRCKNPQVERCLR